MTYFPTALIVGGGGALLREKMVEVVSDKFICIVDESKLSKVEKSIRFFLIPFILYYSVLFNSILFIFLVIFADELSLDTHG